MVNSATVPSAPVTLTCSPGRDGAQPVEHGRLALGVHVPDEEGGARRPRAGPAAEPADRAGPGVRRRVDRPVRSRPRGTTGAATPMDGDLDALRRRAPHGSCAGGSGTPAAGRRRRCRRWWAPSGAGAAVGVPAPQPQAEQQHRPGRHRAGRPEEPLRCRRAARTSSVRPPRRRARCGRATATAATAASTRPITACRVPGPPRWLPRGERAAPPPPACDGGRYGVGVGRGGPAGDRVASGHRTARPDRAVRGAPAVDASRPCRSCRSRLPVHLSLRPCRRPRSRRSILRVTWRASHGMFTSHCSAADRARTRSSPGEVQRARETKASATKPDLAMAVGSCAAARPGAPPRAAGGGGAAGSP